MAEAEVGIIPARKSFYLAPLLGLFAVFGLVVVAIILSNSPDSILILLSIFIVVAARWESQLFSFPSTNTPRYFELPQSQIFIF